LPVVLPCAYRYLQVARLRRACAGGVGRASELPLEAPPPSRLKYSPPARPQIASLRSAIWVPRFAGSQGAAPAGGLGSPLSPFGASLRPEYLSREPSFVSAQASLLSPSPTKLWRPTPPAQKRNGFPYILTACCQASKTSSW